MDELMKRLLMGTQEPGFEIRMEAADTIEALQAQVAEWRSRAEFAESRAMTVELARTTIWLAHVFSPSWAP